MNEYLQQLAHKVSDLSPLMKKIAGVMEYAVLENFRTSGARIGGWEPLSRLYAKRLQKKGYNPAQMLDRTAGGLKHSISTRTGTDFAAIGSNKIYARIHQEGGIIQRAAYEGTVRLRTDARGNLILRPGARFAGAKHKRAVERRFSSSGYVIRIPKREFLKLNEQDMAKIRQLIADYFTRGQG